MQKPPSTGGGSSPSPHDGYHSLIRPQQHRLDGPQQNGAARGCPRSPPRPGAERLESVWAHPLLRPKHNCSRRYGRVPASAANRFPAHRIHERYEDGPRALEGLGKLRKHGVWRAMNRSSANNLQGAATRGWAAPRGCAATERDTRRIACHTTGTGHAVQTSRPR